MGQFGPRQNDKTIGERSEAIIMAKLLEVGYGVLMPFGDNRRYDLVIEDADEQFWRVQIRVIMRVVGLEPTTLDLKGRYSSTELHPRTQQRGALLSLSYALKTGYSLSWLVNPVKPLKVCFFQKSIDESLQGSVYCKRS